MTNGTTSVGCAQGKCELLVSHFASSFTGSGSSSDTTSPASHTSPGLSSIVCDSGDVFKAISSLPSATVSGPDGISSQTLKGTVQLMSSPTPWQIFSISPWSMGLSPLDGSCQTSLQSIRWVTPSSSQTTVQFPSCHYVRSFLSALSCYSSTQEAIISATGDWHQHLDSKKNVPAVFFDLSKAFDTVPHHGLLNALSNIGISGSLDPQVV